MNDNQRLESFLATQQFMVLAVTLPDGTPWATPVKIVKREKNVFEWNSMLNTEHSKALEKNSIMAITIFQKLENSQIGFYAKGHGELVEKKEHGLERYQFTAEACWINDETFVKRETTLS